MKANLVLHQKGDSPGRFLEVLDDSLVNYGLENGDIVELKEGVPEANGVPVWELDGGLHGRFIKDNGGGWAQAYTSFLTDAKICYTLEPAKMAKIKPLGWVGKSPSQSTL